MPNDGLGPRLSEKLRGLTALLFIIYALVAGFGPVMESVDLGWHVAQGRWMVEHFAFYRHDAFNYPNLGHDVIDEYPLFQVVLFAAWFVGWWGPCLLTSLLLAALMFVLWRAVRSADPFLQTRLLAAIGMMLLLLHVGSMLRPHLVSYLCIATLGAFLVRHRDLRSWTQFWPMALLQVAWTNCHSAFVIGPAMVALFGAEVVARRWLSDRAFPRATTLAWLGAFALVLLACFVNPYGIARFYPPFVQEHLESIRAYVGEMEPLPGAVQTSFLLFLAIFAVWFVLSRPQWRGLSLAFIVLAVFFFLEALEARKAWPVFGVMLPLIVLSERAFAPPREKTPGLVHLIANFVIASCIAAALVGGAQSLPGEWRELAAGRSEMSHEAIAWMKTRNVQGKLFHRCEDGGLLQMEGFPQTFSDTGFGKFDEAFIHETGLVNERPALVPRYLAAYKPDYVVCSNFCYQWPYYLKQSGWRLIFYSPNSSVWTKPETRPDLPTVTDSQIEAAFDTDLKTNGFPAETSLFGRNIIALHSLGLNNFVLAKMDKYFDELKPEEGHAPWFWEAARIMSYDEPQLPAQARRHLEGFNWSTPNFPIHPADRTLSTYAFDAGDDNSIQAAAYKPADVSGLEADIRLKRSIEKNEEDALWMALYRSYDLRDGKHWEYLAEAEEKWGSLDAARAAWKKAVFYYPDDDELMKAAADFAAKHNDAELKQAIADSTKIYGAP